MSALKKIADFFFEINGSHRHDPLTIDNLAQWMKTAFEDRPEPFCQRIDKLINLNGRLINKQGKQSILSFPIIGFIANIICQYPKLAKNRKGRCTKILSHMLTTLAKRQKKIEDWWYNPPNHYTGDQDDLSVKLRAEKDLIGLFGRLSVAIGYEQSSSWFFPLFESFMRERRDWRKRYAAIMLASQLSGVDKNLQVVEKFVGAAIIYLKSPNPMLRFASLHLIGQYSDDIKPAFQERYFDEVVPQMVKMINDPVPRIISHSLYALANFLHKYEDAWRMEGFIDEIVTAAVHQLKNANKLVKESFLSMLSSIAGTPNIFGAKLTQILDIGKEMINKFAGEEGYEMVVSQSLEMIGIQLDSQDKNKVEKYVPQFAQMLITHRDSIIPGYFFLAWNRLCDRYSQFINIRKVFDIFVKLAQRYINEDKDEDQDQVEEENDAEQSLSALSSICKCFKEDIIPYREKLFEFAKLQFQNKENSLGIRNNCIIIITSLVIYTKNKNPKRFDKWLQFTLQAINCLKSALNSQNNQIWDQSNVLFRQMSEIIICVSFCLQDNHFQEIAFEMRRFVDECYQIYLTFDQHILDQNKEEERIIEQPRQNVRSIQAILEATVNVVDVYRALLKSTGPQKRLSIIALIQQEVLKYIDKEDDWKRYVFQLNNCLLQECSYSELPGQRRKMELIYLQHCSNINAHIRCKAAKGIGLIALQTPYQNIRQTQIKLWLQALNRAIKEPFQFNTSDQSSNKCKQNVASALGHILHKLGEKYPTILKKQAYDHWFSLLPLNIQKQEGDIQQEYLIVLLQNKSEFLMTSKQDLLRLFNVYGSFLVKRQNYQNKEVIKKTRRSLRAIKKWPLFKNNRKNIWNNLSYQQKSVMARFISG